jgi:hypothetical protein
MVIGFCSVCMNRGWQLSKTLPENLAVLRGTDHFLALCDYNSSDETECVVRTFQEDIERGTLIYFRTPEPSRFHASKAKNTAHRLALRRKPDILFNLDADNYLLPETIELVRSTFEGQEGVYLWNWKMGPEGEGSFGRIAVAIGDWLRVGGYDEGLLGVLWHDMDLLSRLRAAGLRCRADSGHLKRSVPNGFEHKIANIDLPDGMENAPKSALFRRLMEENMRLSTTRPLFFSVSDQQRYRGQLNFGQDAVI